MKIILKGFMFAWLWFCLFFSSSNLWSFDLIQITNTLDVNEENHSIAVKCKSIYLTWQAAGAIYFAKSGNGGLNWSTPIEIGKGLQPSIAVGENNLVYLAWLRADTVFSIYSYDNGVSFPQTHIRIVGRGRCPDVVIDAEGKIHIVYLLYYKDANPIPTPYNTYVVYARSPHPDSAFGSIVNVKKATYGWVSSLNFVVDDATQNFYVAWSGPAPHYIQVHMSVSTDGGNSFQVIPGPTGDGGGHGVYQPCLAFFPNDDIYLVWERDYYHWWDTFFRKFKNHGQEFGPLLKLNKKSFFKGDLSPLFYPTVAAGQDNEVYVVWCYPRSGNKDSTDIYHSMSVDSGKSFREAVCIIDHVNPTSKRNPSIAVTDSDTIGIFWEDNRNGNYDIYCASKIFTSGFNVSGTIQYYFNNKPVVNTTINLAGNKNITNTEGIFSFIGIPESNYTLFPSKDGELGNSISAYDASMIMRNVVGLLSLTPYQMIASDVSGNGDVSAFDASLILRYVVGSFPEFPVGDDWTFVSTSFAIDSTNWAIAPDTLRYEPLETDTLNQDFVGIIYGDVSGNWTSSTDRGASVITEISIGNIQHNNDGRWLIPLEMEFSDEAYSGSFKVLFSNPDLKFTSSSIDSSLTDEILFASNASSGSVNFAFASAQPLNERAVKINIFFEEIKPVTPSVSNFEFVYVVVDDKSATVTVVDNQSDKQVPMDWHLSQNYPNPFNAETIIKYQLPEASKVTLSIYNLSGQEVVRLVDEEKNGGFHQVQWDGKDSMGRSVTSGVYVYRITVDKYEKGRKLVLLR